MNKINAIAFTIFICTGILIGCQNDNENIDTKPIEQEDYTPVSVESVDTRTISEKTTFSGTVVPNKEVMVVPKIPGKVTSLNAEVGKNVSKGSVIFTVDQDDMQKQVEQAKKAVDMAWSNYEQVSEQIENAKVNLERMKELYEQGAIPKTQYEQAQLAASDSTLTTLKIQTEQAELSYNQAVDSLKNASVVSPISGVVSAVNINTGEMASNAQPAIQIIDTSKMYVEMNVPESIISKIYSGQKVEIELPSATDEKLSGVVELVSPSANNMTQLFKVKVRINGNTKSIKSGMFARVILSTYSKENVVAISSDAILEQGGQTYIYLVSENKVVRRNVKVGFDTGEFTEIIEGVKKGEEIITKGQQYVEDGSKVKVIRGEE